MAVAPHAASADSNYGQQLGGTMLADTVVAIDTVVPIDGPSNGEYSPPESSEPSPLDTVRSTVAMTTFVTGASIVHPSAEAIAAGSMASIVHPSAEAIAAGSRDSANSHMMRADIAQVPNSHAASSLATGASHTGQSLAADAGRENSSAASIRAAIDEAVQTPTPAQFPRVRSAPSSDLEAQLPASLDSRDPCLPCRLRVYILEGLVGCAVSTMQCVLVSRRCFLMSHIGYVMVPFSVTAIRTSWAIYTLLDYSFSSTHAETETDSQIMATQLRMLWQCSVWIFPSMSAVLSIWYLFGALLAMASVYIPSEKDFYYVSFIVTAIAMFVFNISLMTEGMWASQHRRYVDQSRQEHQRRNMAFAKVLIGSLPISKYSDLAIENSSDCYNTCLICLEDFEAPHDVTKLRCGHIFHEACAREWLVRHLRCPLRCKCPVSLDVVQQAAPLHRPAAAPQAPIALRAAAMNMSRNDVDIVPRPVEEMGHTRVRLSRLTRLTGGLQPQLRIFTANNLRGAEAN